MLLPFISLLLIGDKEVEMKITAVSLPSKSKLGGGKYDYADSFKATFPTKTIQPSPSQLVSGLWQYSCLDSVVIFFKEQTCGTFWAENW